MDKKILIVEDDDSIRDVLEIILKKAGYQTIIYEDGNAVMKGNYPIPDLFLLDKRLPGMDGLDICRLLKSQEATKEIPVIMISADPQIASLSKQAGADGFIEKPFNLHYLVNTLKTTIEKAQKIAV
jgi:DNA-binding response OmpR family regulator